MSTCPEKQKYSVTVYGKTTLIPAQHAGRKSGTAFAATTDLSIL